MALRRLPKMRFTFLLFLLTTAVLACYIDMLFDQERKRLATISEIESGGGNVVIDNGAGFALFATENVVAIEKCVPFDPNASSDFDHISLLSNSTELRGFKRLSKLTVQGFAVRVGGGPLLPGSMTIPRDAHDVLTKLAK